MRLTARLEAVESRAANQIFTSIKEKKIHYKYLKTLCMLSVLEFPVDEGCSSAFLIILLLIYVAKPINILKRCNHSVSILKIILLSRTHNGILMVFM